MSLLKTLRVTHTACRLGQPLAVIDNLPGEGAEFTPVQLRQLASVLVQAASDCEAALESSHFWIKTRREYMLDAAPTAPEREDFKFFFPTGFDYSDVFTVRHRPAIRRVLSLALGYPERYQSLTGCLRNDLERLGILAGEIDAVQQLRHACTGAQPPSGDMCRRTDAVPK